MEARAMITSACTSQVPVQLCPLLNSAHHYVNSAEESSDPSLEAEAHGSSQVCAG